MDLSPLVGLFGSLSSLKDILGSITLNIIINRKPNVILERGQSTIISEFSWSKFKIIKKVVTMNQDGSISINTID